MKDRLVGFEFVKEVNGDTVVSHIDIAAVVDQKPRSIKDKVIRNLKHFESLGPIIRQSGVPETIFLLTEEQFGLLMSFLQSNDKVIAARVRIFQEYRRMKEALKSRAALSDTDILLQAMSIREKRNLELQAEIVFNAPAVAIGRDIMKDSSFDNFVGSMCGIASDLDKVAIRRALVDIGEVLYEYQGNPSYYVTSALNTNFYMENKGEYSQLRIDGERVDIVRDKLLQYLDGQ